MEAKDTVMKGINAGVDIPGDLNEGIIDITSWLETQAGISFKAGVKEVVKYIETRGLFFPIKADIEFQAKLKEWGITGK